MAAILLAVGVVGCSGDDDSTAGMDGDPFNNSPGGHVNTSDPFNAPGAGVAGRGGGVSPSTAGNCPSVTARTGRVVPRVILLLDGSCSMSTPYPANGAMSATECRNVDGSRWNSLRNALVGENGVVRRLEGVVEFGLVIFGTSGRCPIPGEPIEPAISNFSAIEDAFPRGTPPGQFTPTGPALDYVYENLVDKTTGPDQAARPQIVVLATDGEPNSCDNAQPTYELSERAVTENSSISGIDLKTYVISLADATGMFHDHLQKLADIGAGGQGKLYTPSTPEELEADLGALIGGAVGCDLTLNGRVAEGKQCAATVMLNSQPLKCNDDNGWVLTDPTHIRLQGTACDTLKASANATVSANFPCGTFMVM